jgi:hypothetical protein
MQEHDSQEEKDENKGVTHPGAFPLEIFAAPQQPFGHKQQPCDMKKQAYSNDQRGD